MFVTLWDVMGILLLFFPSDADVLVHDDCKQELTVGTEGQYAREC